SRGYPDLMGRPGSVRCQSEGLFVYWGNRFCGFDKVRRTLAVSDKARDASLDAPISRMSRDWPSSQSATSNAFTPPPAIFYPIAQSLNKAGRSTLAPGGGVGTSALTVSLRERPYLAIDKCRPRRHCT